MTNKDRLISLLGFAPPDDSLEGALLDSGLVGSAVYDGGTSVLLKTIAVSIMELLLTTADTTGEAGYVIRYDRNAVLARIKLLKAEIGVIDDSVPIITTKAVW